MPVDVGVAVDGRGVPVPVAVAVGEGDGVAEAETGVLVEVGVALAETGVLVEVGVAVLDELAVVVKLCTSPTELLVAFRATAYHSYSVLFANPGQVKLASEPEGTITDQSKVKSGDNRAYCTLNWLPWSVA